MASSILPVPDNPTAGYAGDARRGRRGIGLGRSRAASLAAGLTFVLAALAACEGPSRRDGMMGRGGMREMMRGMMGGVVPEGTAPEDLPEPDGRGARLLARYCEGCHALPSPRMHSPEEWPPIVARMTARMRHMEGMGGMMMMDRVRAPTPEEESALLEYLKRFALRPIPSDALSDAAGAAAVTFARVCSRCHAPPDPGLHAPEEWRAVVARMEGHEVAMGRPPITESEREEIVGFLRARSAARE